MAIKKINIEKLLRLSREYKALTEDDIAKLWSKRELVELIINVIESLKK